MDSFDGPFLAACHGYLLCVFVMSYLFGKNTGKFSLLLSWISLFRQIETDVAVKAIKYSWLYTVDVNITNRNFSVKMPVKGVYLTADCYSVCLAHALTTEKEEIMGLLIGEVCYLFISACFGY